MIYSPRRNFVHLAYLDDSDTKAKVRKWQVMAGILVPDNMFTMLEIAVGVLRDMLVTEHKVQKFTEFHACELYGGYGPFEGIEQSKRFKSIDNLLSLLAIGDGLPIVYGAVDIAEVRNQIYGSADPLDMSFRMCCHGIESWKVREIMKRAGITQPHNLTPEEIGTKTLNAGFLTELVMLIVDDCDRREIKQTLIESYRQLRPTREAKNITTSQLFHFHDDLYFGDSRYSIGIQLADLCAYFIGRHLAGDVEIDGFYQKIEPHIVAAELHPATEQTKKELEALNEHELRALPPGV
jgi:hypothetical protein